MEVQEAINELHRMQKRLRGPQGCSVTHQQANEYTAECIRMAIWALSARARKIRFKTWKEIRDLIPYFNSDNILFNMRGVATLELVLKRRDDTSPKEIKLTLSNGQHRQWEFTEANYKEACSIIQEEYDTYIDKVMSSYTTERQIYNW